MRSRVAPELCCAALVSAVDDMRVAQVAISEQYLIPKAQRDHGMDKVKSPEAWLLALLYECAYRGVVSQYFQYYIALNIFIIFPRAPPCLRKPEGKTKYVYKYIYVGACASAFKKITLVQNKVLLFSRPFRDIRLLSTRAALDGQSPPTCDVCIQFYVSLSSSFGRTTNNTQWRFLLFPFSPSPLGTGVCCRRPPGGSPRTRGDHERGDREPGEMVRP